MSKNYAGLPVFLIAVVGLGLLLGYTTRPAEWYQALEKPFFNPPGWLFAPIWTLVYALIAVAGWRTWALHRQSSAMRLWFVQMALNFSWSPAFFGANSIGLGLIIIILMLLAITAYMVSVRGLDALSFWLFVPYLCWVAYATLLNLSLYLMN